jgi:hypothetical protein
MGRAAVDPAIRFWAKVDKSGECWVWTAAVYPRGYGAFRASTAQNVRAHRWSYEEAHGPIPEGFVVRHACDNPACVRPDHLSLGDAAENQRDMTVRGRGRTGSRNGAARLTEDDVRAIRRLYRSHPGGRRKGDHRRDDVARQFGVTGKTVHEIVSGKAWRHVTD